MQKLKKKAKVHVEDPILIFYHFGEKAKNLNEAVNKETKMIENAVKKPFVSLKEHCGFLDLATDIGSIEGEEYILKICPAGPIFNQDIMQECYGESAAVLTKAVLSKSYQATKNQKTIKINLDGKDCILEEGKHFKNLI